MNSNGPDQISGAPIAELPRASLIGRFVAIGMVILGIAVLFAYAGGWLTPHSLTPARIVNNFELVSGGPHPGFRRNHAKGVSVSGYFDSNGQGAALCKASIFLPGRVPIIGRFSVPSPPTFPLSSLLCARRGSLCSASSYSISTASLFSP